MLGQRGVEPVLNLLHISAVRVGTKQGFRRRLGQLVLIPLVLIDDRSTGIGLLQRPRSHAERAQAAVVLLLLVRQRRGHGIVDLRAALGKFLQGLFFLDFLVERDVGFQLRPECTLFRQQRFLVGSEGLLVLEVGDLLLKLRQFLLRAGQLVGYDQLGTQRGFLLFVLQQRFSTGVVSEGAGFMCSPRLAIDALFLTCTHLCNFGVRKCFSTGGSGLDLPVDVGERIGQPIGLALAGV